MSVLSHFKTLSQIPHCSYRAAAMKIYIMNLAELYGYEVLSDKAENVLCRKEGSSITLQSHYDMVCIGNAPELKLEEREGWLYANDSTLGADNAMGMAMMLSLMEEGVTVDALFTADEEVGLLGARALDLPLSTPYLLNLDSEDEGVVTIGCAGGVDIMATIPLTFEKRTLFCYEIESSGYVGGHSGVDIDKNIPNAIKELSAKLAELNPDAFVSFEGGERRNSIAKHAVGVVCFEKEQFIDGAKALGEQDVEAIEQNVVAMLHAFAHGVRRYNSELAIVQTSINLAIVEQNETDIMIHLSVRSMDRDQLRRLENETVTYFEMFGATVTAEGFYAPWEPEESDFVHYVTKISQKILGDAEVGAIHAGLECGIIKEKFPQMKMVSIGPTIRYPHSTRECVSLASVERVYAVVKELCEDVR